MPKPIEKIISYQHPDVQELAFALLRLIRSGGIQSKTVILTDAQIKALPTTPVEIIPAPGAGKIVFAQSVLFRTIQIVGYSNIDANSFLGFSTSCLESISEAVDSGVSDLLNDPGVWIVTLGQRHLVPAAGVGKVTYGTISSADTDYVNVPVTISVANGGSGNLTGGDPANTLQVTVLYTIIDV